MTPEHSIVNEIRSRAAESGMTVEQYAEESIQQIQAFLDNLTTLEREPSPGRVKETA